VLSLYGGKLIGMAAQRLRGTMTGAMRGAMGGGFAGITGRASTLTRVTVNSPSYGRGFLGALKSPFVRSPTDMARMIKFKEGAGFFNTLGGALKQGNPFNLKNLFKFDDDVA